VGEAGNGDALSKAARASCGLTSGVYEWTLISCHLFLSEAVSEVGFTAKRLSLDTRPGAGGLRLVGNDLPGSTFALGARFALDKTAHYYVVAYTKIRPTCWIAFNF
jgi:hypothetical protein